MPKLDFAVEKMTLKASPKVFYWNEARSFGRCITVTLFDKVRIVVDVFRK